MKLWNSWRGGGMDIFWNNSIKLLSEMEAHSKAMKANRGQSECMSVQAKQKPAFELLSTPTLI